MLLPAVRSGGRVTGWPARSFCTGANPATSPNANRPAAGTPASSAAAAPAAPNRSSTKNAFASQSRTM